MINNRILIAEDDALSGKLIYDSLSANGFSPDLAQNGKEALELYQKIRYPLVITDIEMPVMDGNELINRIQALNYDTVIIITSVHSDPSLIVRNMKKGVYDYIIKPIHIDDLIFKIKRALDSVTLLKNNRILEKEKKIRMESQLDWYRWVEKMKNKKLNIKDASLFAGLKASFSQGAGFGSMLNILELICNHGEIKDDIYQIDYSLIELAKNNLGIVRKGIDAFSELDFIEKHSIELEKTSIDDLYKLVQDKMQEASKYLLIKKNRLLLSKNKDHFKYNFINCNLDYLSRVITEVLINAIKFSNQYSEISAIITIDDEMLQISIYNIAERINDDIIGIPEEYENLIFEPFFRMNKSIDEGYDTLEYGIGLTLCEKIIKKHNGQINIMNITDHSDLKQGSVTKVCCEIRIPIINE